MYAVFQTGAHQYRVKEGDTITIDKIEGKAGEAVTFEKVMLVGGSKLVVGAPLVAGASVQATIAEQTHNPKIIIFKYRRRKNYKRTQGHKQPVTVVTIGKIKA
jgi:large subunit ribosomal protein L21